MIKKYGVGVYQVKSGEYRCFWAPETRGTLLDSMADTLANLQKCGQRIVGFVGFERALPENSARELLGVAKGLVNLMNQGYASFVEKPLQDIFRQRYIGSGKDPVKTKTIQSNRKKRKNL